MTRKRSVGAIYRNPEGARFRVLGYIRDVGWITTNLDQVFAVKPGAKWRRSVLPDDLEYQRPTQPGE